MSVSKPLSEIDLKNFCKKCHLPFHIINLDELNKNFENLTEKSYFIYTGDENNEYNKNNTHHFFLTVGNYYFDSFGNTEKLQVPSELKLLVTKPKQLQEYYDVHKDSVCGEYCCLFLKCVEDNNDKNIEEIPTIFVDQYGLGSNRHENDEIIAQEFKKATARKDSSSDESSN